MLLNTSHHLLIIHPPMGWRKEHGVKKITGDIDTNISQFLLHYRSCPQSTSGETPSMLMMKRQIRTRIDILLPDRQLKCWGKEVRGHFTQGILYRF